MSGEEEDITKPSYELINQVKTLIEMCLELYMSQKEVFDYLQKQANIEPRFTELVWQRLEKENPIFFKAYHLRVELKNQISRFNELLEKQAELMHASDTATQNNY